ncbi:MAG TPA: haloacid dehalogenase type II [Verrucomicrobiae bacterium]|nr:haloacid dehalogenase type II [Verrucomicrobiae bacterium]
MAISLVAFDLYVTLLDLDALAGAVSEFTPMAQALVEAWRARQLQLANLATSTGRYVDFDRLTLVALHETATRYHLKLAPQDQKRLLDAWTQLPAQPDAAEGLAAVQRHGYRAVVLTNALESTARNALQYAGLADSFDGVVSADAAQTYKPAPAVYRLIGERFGTKPQEVVFVSAHDWDAGGARQIGFHSVWLRRGRLGQGHAERAIDDLTALDGVLEQLAGQ